MNRIIAQSLKNDIVSQLKLLKFEPEAIIMSPALHEALDKPSGIRGISITIDSRSEKHWKLKIY